MNLVSVTVAPGKVLHVNQSGFVFRYSAGETVLVPAFEVKYLTRAKVIV